MGWIPGWDSIASAGWWSGFFFWASIVSLIGLGISEIASHRYSERKDELVELQQIAEKKQHDDEIALLQKDTAQTNERAARLEKEAAEANERTAKLKLELDERKNRTLTADQKVAIIERLKPLPKGKILFNPLMSDAEASQFSDKIQEVLKAAGYEVEDVPLKDRLLSLNRTGTFLWFKDAKNPPDRAKNIATAFRLVGITIWGETQPDIADPDMVMLVVGGHP